MGWVFVGWGEGEGEGESEGESESGSMVLEAVEGKRVDGVGELGMEEEIWDSWSVGKYGDEGGVEMLELGGFKGGEDRKVNGLEEEVGFGTWNDDVLGLWRESVTHWKLHL